ncbi:GEVED domain-containing protein [Flavobacterium sp. 25HG05S-40]|uniref:GEVED domain-containing protein n=1 Tax=Flavobacterium sp. 25HG05S-40 TaxID=3458682 RepID=UPI004044C0F3
MEKNYYNKTSLYTNLNIAHSLKKVVLIFFMFIGCPTIFGQVTYTTGSGNFIVPCDVTSITVQIWGGGGAGGGANNNNNGGSGGGAGGYSTAILTVTPGSSIAYSVGTGGTGSNGNGGPGIATTFGALTANGGTGGGQNRGAIGTGGNASGGTTNLTGNNGSLGTTTVGAAGGNANGVGGGAGGASRNTAGAGNPGFVPGGGGGGGFRTTATNRAGGNGARGEIRITYTSTLLSYCSPTFTDGMEPITNVTFAGINNTTSNTIGGTQYLESFCNTASVQQGQTVPIAVKGNTAGVFTNYFRLYVDWNNNGTFGDVANEIYDLGTIYNSTGIDAVVLNTTITVPATAPLGTTRMRLMKRFNSYSTGPCQTGAGYGQAEDYSVTVTAPPPCTTPTTQPTALVLSSISSTSINGSFTAATPAPSGYLVVRSSSVTPPTLSSGTTYAVGFTGLTPGTTYVVQGSAVTSNAVTFSDTGLTSNTNYYYHIFSYNNACTGAPAYLTTSPLNNSATTCAAAPVSATNSAITVSSFTVTWPASVVGGGVGTINYTLEIYSDAGYSVPVLGSPFAMGTSLSYNATGLNSGTPYYYRIRANNGFCNSPYISGNCTTLITNDECSSAISLTVNPSTNCVTSTNATSVGATQSIAGCTGTADDDVWFSFVATGTTHTITVTPNTINNVVIEPFTGLCGSLTSVGCINNTTGSAIEAVSLIGMTSGVTYFFRVFSNGNAANAGSFNICITSPPTNDECSGAIPLSISSTCSYATYSNAGATNSTGMTAPGCASYLGGDVWFSVVVPATGEINIDLQTGTVLDGGLALYSGTCGALTLLDCDDDSSTNGAMPFLRRTGLTPGQTIYIRVWEYGNNNNGTFGICATTPSCPSPSDLYADILSTTSVTVNWTASSPPASGGYQYYISNSPTPPIASTPPTGTTAPGVISVTLTGLTTGLKYYFWVRSFCGGSDTSTWFGSTNYTPCSIGSGTGTTSLACPSVLAGGLGLSGGNPVPLTCTALTCVDLEANYLQLYQPTNYSVTSITDAPPYQFTCLQRAVSVNVDDVWSSTVNLPFNFCFYGVNYDKCLIGSNGVITFDTTNNLPGGYNPWLFTNNLPNTGLIRNAIFGVYHDIDPSKGGEVGWELITLNTGCRALVASWSDIPMYSSACNSSYYTGMIVLYENTNVIEVYVKEKNVCATWNDGNAIVGIQNAAGNAAVVAPGRNGLDANWTITDEAWRFTPTGTTLTSIKWFEGNGTTGPQIGTTNTINVCPSITTTYTAEVTYALCSGTNLTYTDNVVVGVNGNKVWDGSQSSDWNDPNNWTPGGVPTNAHCVVVPVTGNNPVLATIPDGVGYNLAVYNGAQLTINSSRNLTITDRVNIQPSGNFTINNNSNLVQINDAAVNSGSIFYKRIAPNIKGSDYVYWSSPVLNQNIGTFYDSTFPYASGFKYQWNTTVNNGNGVGPNISQGNWENASGVMARARGYIIRGSNSFGMPASNIPTTFNGVPFNGSIPYTVQRGVYTGAPYSGANGVQITNLNDNFNLLGNPYPSSINALKFLQTNTYHALNNPTGVLLGNLKLWTHGTDPYYGVANPFYGSFTYNYDEDDYITINYLGSTSPGVGDIIKTGQAFFAQMIDGAAGSGIVNFNNSMRYDGATNPYDNSGFFKNENFTNEEFSLERHRIWLDLVDSNNQSSRMLMGYANDATNSVDTLFDAPTYISTGTKLFSLIENSTDIYEIQGRSLPFDITDEIPIGIKAPTQGNYSFAIATVDGLFESQTIYLKDELLNITHNLKLDPYHFTTISGIINDRFKIVYVDNALGIPELSIDENSIKVIANSELAVSSSSLEMESITVFNLLGQKLDTYENINDNYWILSNLRKNNTTLLLKIKLQTGETVTRKVIF